MKYSSEEIKALLVSSIPKWLKKEQVKKDFIKGIVLDSVLAAGAITGIILSIVHGQWVLFAFLILALLAVAVLFLSTFRRRTTMLGLESNYYSDVEAGNYQVETDFIVQKTFNPNVEGDGRYSIMLASGNVKSLFKYFYELCEINDTVYTIQTANFPFPTGFVLSKKNDSDKEYPLN